MNRNFILRLSGLMILLSLAACQQSAKPTPVLFSDAQLTSIANTAQVSMQQTQQSYTPTPVPSTATPKVSSISGSSLEVREDQTAQFVDHKAGIQITIPAGWLPVRLNEEEYYKAFALDVVVANKPLSDLLTQIQSYNIDFFRLGAIDIRPGHIVGDLPTAMDVLFEKDNRTLAEWLQAERTHQSPFKGFKILSYKYQEMADGTRVLVFEESWDGTPTEKVYLKRIFFSVPAGAVILDLETNISFKDTVLPDFEQVVNSLTLLNP